MAGAEAGAEAGAGAGAGAGRGGFRAWTVNVAAAAASVPARTAAGTSRAARGHGVRQREGCDVRHTGQILI
jgi:hypothetical protein